MHDEFGLASQLAHPLIQGLNHVELHLKIKKIKITMLFQSFFKKIKGWFGLIYSACKPSPEPSRNCIKSNNYVILNLISWEEII